MAQVLVTGCNGFVGKHLVRELHSRNIEVSGLGYKEPAHPEIASLLSNYFMCDLTDPEDVATLDLKNLEAVVNLAGLAKMADSFANPEFYKKVNVEVLTNLGGELLRQNKNARVIAVSTGAVYESDQPMPLTEDSKTVNDSSPYSQSKLMMEIEAKKLRSRGVECVVVRPFNHIGPGQEQGFLLPDLLEKIKGASEAENTISVGNLNTKRDYTDVRDIVKAYASLALSNSLANNLYNICSGNSYSGEEILQIILDTVGIKGVKIEVDQSLIRPNDPPNLYGSNNRLRADINWLPEIPLRKTIEDFIGSKS